MRIISPKENRRELGHVPKLFRRSRVDTGTPAYAMFTPQALSPSRAALSPYAYAGGHPSD